MTPLLFKGCRGHYEKSNWLKASFVLALTLCPLPQHICFSWKLIHGNLDSLVDTTNCFPTHSDMNDDGDEGIHQTSKYEEPKREKPEGKKCEEIYLSQMLCLRIISRLFTIRKWSRPSFQHTWRRLVICNAILIHYCPNTSRVQWPISVLLPWNDTLYGYCFKRKV